MTGVFFAGAFFSSALAGEDFFAASSFTAGLNFALDAAFFACGFSSMKTSGLKAFFFAGALTSAFAGAFFAAVLTSAFAGAFFAAVLTSAFAGAFFATGAELCFFDADEARTGVSFFADCADFTLPGAPFPCLEGAADFAFFPAEGTAIRFVFASFFIEKKLRRFVFLH